MNEATVNKLKKNPHYRMTADQQKPQAERAPMVEFGEPEIHDTNIPIHKTEFVKRKRVGKKELQTEDK